MGEVRESRCEGFTQIGAKDLRWILIHLSRPSEEGKAVRVSSTSQIGIRLSVFLEESEEGGARGSRQENRCEICVCRTSSFWVSDQIGLIRSKGTD